jgi:uncharacterized protein (DUF1330 family)
VAPRVVSVGQPEEHFMNRQITLGLAMLAGAVLGAAAISGLNAQGAAPGAYVVVDISDIGSPDVFNTLLPKADAANAAFGGKFIIRTGDLVARDGTPPKRLVVIGFDTMEKAKAWSDSPAQKEVDAIRMKSAKGRTFFADGKVN